MRKVLAALGIVVAAFLITRAVIEPFAIDMSDPATYRNDWGGPSLAGVLAVHCGPGILAAAIVIRLFVRRFRSIETASTNRRGRS